MSLKEGEKITIKFGNMPNVAKPTGAGAPVKKSGGGLKKLAPPPGFKGKPKAGGSSAGVDLLGGGASN